MVMVKWVRRATNLFHLFKGPWARKPCSQPFTPHVLIVTSGECFRSTARPLFLLLLLYPSYDSLVCQISLRIPNMLLKSLILALTITALTASSLDESVDDPSIARFLDTDTQLDADIRASPKFAADVGSQMKAKTLTQARDEIRGRAPTTIWRLNPRRRGSQGRDGTGGTSTTGAFALLLFHPCQFVDASRSCKRKYHATPRLSRARFFLPRTPP